MLIKEYLQQVNKLKISLSKYIFKRTRESLHQSSLKVCFSKKSISTLLAKLKKLPVPLNHYVSFWSYIMQSFVTFMSGKEQQKPQFYYFYHISI